MWWVNAIQDLIEDIFYEQTLRCCFNITILLSTVSHLRSYVLDGWAVDCSIAWYLLIKTNNLVVKFKVKSHDISSLPGLEETGNHDHDKIIIFHPSSLSLAFKTREPSKPWSSSSSSSVTAPTVLIPKFSRRNANLGIEMFQTVTVKLSKSIWAIGHSLVQPPILSKTKTWIKWIFPRKISPSKLIIYANNFPISVREI